MNGDDPHAEVPAEELKRVMARKRVELEQKLAGLRSEFDRWTADAGPKRPLRKHQSQIQQLTDQLGGMTDGVETLLAEVAKTSLGLLRESRTMQMRVLEVHRLWDYYRSKLGLRYVTWYADFLAAADELAWECYEPARRRAAAAGPRTSPSKAAPLVFLTDEYSPYTHARNAPYEVEDVPDALPESEFEAIAAELPVPVIGVPWYQVAHLPDAPLICHEVGHDLEAELGLTGAMREHLDPVLVRIRNAHQNDGDDRARAWDAWRRELFADLYGLLCLGPAFVAAMADLLATDPVQVADQSRLAQSWDPHPPAAVRMRALSHALALQGFAEEGTALRLSWESVFPPDPGDRFIDDVPAVVEALWNGTYPQFKGPLKTAISFTNGQQQMALAVSDGVSRWETPPTTDIRCLVAGARLAFDADPDGYQRSPQPNKPNAQQLILNRVLALRTNTPRSAEIARSPGTLADREAGRALFERIQRSVAADAIRRRSTRTGPIGAGAADSVDTNSGAADHQEGD